MGVTVREISQLAQVSPITVSRVLNPRLDFPVAAETQRRVLEAAQELGYTPNRVARALATGRTQLVALWLPRISNVFYSQVIAAFNPLLKADGYEMVISETRYADHLEELEEEEIDVHRMNAMHVDGVLIYDSPTWIPAYIRTGLQEKTPYCSLGIAWENTLPHILVDLYPASRQAMTHLMERGCRRIAFCTNASSLELTGEARLKAYRDVMAEAGLKPEYLPLAAETRLAARNALPHYVREHGCPDALFCRNDEIAIGFQRGAHDLKLSLPADLAVIGCDGLAEGEYHVPSLSTIQQPLAQICRLGWEQLKRQMTDPGLSPTPQSIIAGFIPRESSQWQQQNSETKIREGMERR